MDRVKQALHIGTKVSTDVTDTKDADKKDPRDTNDTDSKRTSKCAAMEKELSDWCTLSYKQVLSLCINALSWIVVAHRVCFAENHRICCFFYWWYDNAYHGTFTYYYDLHHSPVSSLNTVCSVVRSHLCT